MKTNILFIIENFSYRGGEKIFEQIITNLDGNKYRPFLACLPQGLLIDRVRGKAEIIPLDLSSQFNIRNIFRIVSIIKKHDISIVHTQSSRANFYGRIAASIANTRVVTTVQMPPEGFDVGTLRKFIYVFLDRCTERFVDFFVPCSQALKKQLIANHHIREEKITLIQNSVDTKEYNYDAGIAAEVRKEFNIPAGAVLAGVICSLVWQKGLTHLLDAIELLNCKTTVNKAYFLIVGDGPEREKLELKAVGLGIKGSVVFTGFRSDVEKIMSAIDIFVLPSLREGQPLAILEAMAAGKPVITTDIEGMNETIKNGETGILTTPADPAALADSIASLLKNKDLAHKLGLAARKEVENNYTVSGMVKEYENVYEKVLNPAKGFK